MYKVRTTFEISAAHRLELPYNSPCRDLHGHNWTIDVYCAAESLDANGMVVDFTRVKRLITDCFDHKTINDVSPGNPTAENLACYIASLINDECRNDDTGFTCYRVDVAETRGNVATFDKDF